MYSTDQKIVVNCSQGRFNQLKPHAIQMARLLKRELCLFYYQKDISVSEYERIKTQLENYGVEVKKVDSHIPVSTLVLKGKFLSFEEMLTNKSQCILFISSREESEEIRKALHELRFPVMFLGENETQKTSYKNVMLPVDLTRKNKESAPWASYMGRFNQSEVTLLVANEKSKMNSEEVEKNLKAINRLFSKFSFSHQTKQAEANSWKLHHEILERIQNNETDLLIFMASRSVNFIDRLIGIPEDKIILNATVPVICLNPNRDYYLLCE